MKYKDFDDWFWEVENYATRGERFLDNFRHMTDREATEWLRTAWACATGELEKSDTHDR